MLFRSEHTSELQAQDGIRDAGVTGVQTCALPIFQVSEMCCQPVVERGPSQALLSAYRSGDSNMRSVWLCSRNDLIGNCAVLASAPGVARTGAAWPDVLVAAIMAILALQGAAVVVTQARAELIGAAA